AREAPATPRPPRPAPDRPPVARGAGGAAEPSRRGRPGPGPPPRAVPSDGAHRSPRSPASWIVSCERAGDRSHAPEAIHPDLLIGDGPTDGPFGPGDELEDPDRVQPALLEQPGVPADGSSGPEIAAVEPLEQLGLESLPAHGRLGGHAASWLSRATAQWVATRWDSIRGQYSRTAGAGSPRAASAPAVSKVLGSVICSMKVERPRRIRTSFGSPISWTDFSKSR